MGIATPRWLKGQKAGVLNPNISFIFPFFLSPLPLLDNAGIFLVYK
jgi:hypothetical protein